MHVRLLSSLLIVLYVFALVAQAGLIYKSRKSLKRANKRNKIRSQYATYGVEQPSWIKKTYRKFIRAITCSGQFLHEYQDAPKDKPMSYGEIVDYMQKVDNFHEAFVRSRLLDNNKLLIIAPTLSSGQVQQVAERTLNPVIYIDGIYSIVFLIGQRYPIDRPYMSIYLTTCKAPFSPRTKHMLHIRTVMVAYQGVFNDKKVFHVTTQPLNVTTTYWTPERVSKLYTTSEGAYVFEWQVPQYPVQPAENFCFLFDMSEFNPSDSLYLQNKYQSLEASSKLHRVSNIRPSTFWSQFHTLGHYHSLQASFQFPIRNPPGVFSEAWFARLFGGADLLKFMGGELMAFKDFMVIYNSEDKKPRWPKEMFLKIVMAKGKLVSEWFSEVIYDTMDGFRQGGFSADIRPAYMNTGFSLLETRRKAQQRAVGLLYHPMGKHTLKQIGKIFLKIAEDYETTLTPYHFWKELFQGIYVKMRQLWHEYIAGFSNARSRLVKWTKRFKLITDTIPSQAAFEDLISDDYSKRVRRYNPLTGQSQYNPKVVYKNIVKAVRDMMLYEIRLTLIYMGNHIMVHQSRTDMIVDAMFNMGTYQAALYANVASVIRLYGTKFVSMADNFVVGKDTNMEKPFESQKDLWSDADDNSKDADGLGYHDIYEQEYKSKLVQASKIKQNDNVHEEFRIKDLELGSEPGEYDERYSVAFTD